MAGHLVKAYRPDLSKRLYDCGSYLRFRHYLDHQQTRLIESRSCDISLLCPLCAIRRGARLLKRYLERCAYLAPAHDFYLVTLTVKNGPDLAERYAHLLKGWKRLNERAKKGYGAFADASGAFGSIEFTKSDKGWHPHMHMLWAMPKGTPPLRWGQDSQLGMDWFAATGDSYIVHAERVAPAAPPVITPAAPALASTGAEAVVPFAAGALAVLGVGVALVAGRRRVRRAR